MSSYRPDRHRAFVAGIAYHQSFAAMVIGGVHDHVHALLLLPPSLALAEAIQILKGSSSKWINETNCTNALFARREGYAAFGVSLFAGRGSRSLSPEPAGTSREGKR
jgi:REP element-mobilizing transposase RayT